MAHPVASTKDVFEDLTQVQFREERNSLNFRFVEAHETTMPYISNSMSPTIYERTVFPDAIRFSPNSELVKKIEELAKGIQLHHIHRSYHPESGYHGICAKDSKTFFEAISQLQAEESKICIPTKLFHNTLNSLQEHRYITPSDVETFQSNIQTSITLKEYIRETRETRDVKKAISLAQYFRNTKGEDNNTLAIAWLCEAKKYLGDQSLGELIDLDEFFSKFEVINSMTIFSSEEIAEAVARCPSIKTFYFDSCEDIQRLASLLTTTTTIEKVLINLNNTGKLPLAIVTLIADALKTNTSIQKLDLSYTQIGDEGVLKLVQAIDSNPESKITDLIFSNCKMTDVSASKLLELVKKREQITLVNINYNSYISWYIEKEIQEVLKERNYK